jgi:hypothetical protein
LYRILRPNGLWVTDEQWPERLRINNLKAAVEYAQRLARITNDYGEFLIYEGNNDTPSASARMHSLFDEDE